MSKNIAMLIGNLGKDPEIRKTQSGKNVCSFSIATTEKYKDKTETIWHNIIAWDKLADLCAKYLQKGSKVFLMGKINNRSYDDKDGNKKYISEVVINSIEFLSKAENTTTQNTVAEPIPQESEIDDLPF